MRRFLYISPYFPPQSRVGALRPLKFARHLPKHGWAPVVLADLKEADAMDRSLPELVPDSTITIFDYSKVAAPNYEKYLAGELPNPEFDLGGKPKAAPKKSWKPKFLQKA